jgi:hypothetical protein
MRGGYPGSAARTSLARQTPGKCLAVIRRQKPGSRYRAGSTRAALTGGDVETVSG